MADIFMSYSRLNEANAKKLAEDIQRLGHTVWVDQELSGGQAWWNQILAQIRDCDVFVFVLAPEALNSLACQREYSYAEALGKQILPVLVGEGVSSNLLPPSLSQIQYVDYRTQDRDAAFRLARALASLSPRQPLPDPLPDPPEVPISYLGSLAQQIETASTLSFAEQSSLVLDLKRSLRDPVTRDDARALLERMRKRRDLLAAIADEVDELLSSLREVQFSPLSRVEPEPSLQEPSAAERQHLEEKNSWYSKIHFRAVFYGAFVGTMLVAFTFFLLSEDIWQSVVFGMGYGAIPWGIAGAITQTNKKRITMALLGGAVGFVVMYPPDLIRGVVVGAGGGVMVGAIVSRIIEVILKTRKR